MKLQKTKSTLCLVILALLFSLNANAQKSKIRYLTDTITSFDQLISKFKNKIVYIDYWATWCSPCRQELRDVKAIKKFEDFAVKNDIVILYVCVDYDGQKWKPFINENHLNGYHLLTNLKLDTDTKSKFSFYENRRGKLKKGFYIPRHLIIDQKGIVADSMALDRRNPNLYAELQNLIGKH